MFLVESFWATLIDIWRHSTGHTDCGLHSGLSQCSDRSFLFFCKTQLSNASNADYCILPEWGDSMIQGNGISYDHREGEMNIA